MRPSPLLRGGVGLLLHDDPGILRRDGGRAVLGQMRGAAAPISGAVSAGRWGGRDRDRGGAGRRAGTSSPSRRTGDGRRRTVNPRGRAVMTRIAPIIALTLLASRGLAAQDTTTATKAAAPAAAVEVTEAVVAKTVVDRQPQDTGSTFTADVGQVVCWTKVGGAEGSSIHHVWFHGDTQVGDVELQVGGSPWRTWSRKTVPADWTGAWHVEVRDAAGTVLKRIDFTVGQ